MTPGALILILVVVSAAVALLLLVRRVIIYDFQTALLYRDGRFVRRLEPGAHFLFKPVHRVEIADTRRALVTVPGQEILTKDLVNLRLSLSCGYRLADPVKALRDWSGYLPEFYAACQLAMRAHVAGLTLDELLTGRAETDAQLREAIAAKAKDYGLEVEAVAVRDIMLPGSLKRAYAGVLEARKEAERRLEEARGEQAVLRSLANAARLYADNPALVQARVIQALDSGGNTVVFGAVAEKLPPAKPRKGS